MLSPIAIATWISVCIPWAEPRLAAALIYAGSGGEANMIADATERKDVAKTQTEALRILRGQLNKTDRQAIEPQQELYIGLTQIPLTAIRELAIDPEIALDTCANLEIGYTVFINAYQMADKIEKNPWKRTALAYNYFRTRQKQFETPYSIQAINHLKSGTSILPAPMTNPLYHTINAEWATGLASRHAMRQPHNPSSVLIASRKMADNARNMY